MKVARTLGMALGAAVFASASIPASFAQGEGGGGSVFGGGSRAPFMSAGVRPQRAGSDEACPVLTWHINRTPAANGTTTMSGPLWYEGGTGVSFANGTGTADGSFTLNVTSISGKGPTGTLNGTRHRDGSIDVTATGSPCFAGNYHLKPGQTSARG